MKKVTDYDLFSLTGQYDSLYNNMTVFCTQLLKCYQQKRLLRWQMERLVFCSVLTMKKFKSVGAVWLERVESWLNHVSVSHVLWKESEGKVRRQNRLWKE